MEHLVIGICHEMNTPLGVATTGLSHLVKGTEELNNIFKSGQLTRSRFTELLNDGSEAISLIDKNLDRLNILITSFKNISILQRSYAHTSFNIASVIDEQVFFSKESLAGHIIKVSCPTDLTINSYPQALSDMIQQFINNSLRHGFIDETPGEIDISVHLNSKDLEIVYRDNGIGISQDKHKDIFNPFSTTKRGSKDNVGLGMFQVYNIVTQLLEGDIHIVDTLNGFEVIVRFPIEST
jgi:signal transduction histidine kinase